MRLIIFVLIFIFPLSLISQGIPWAGVQPKWTLPLYAKDAAGKRDTVYFSYDPSANNTYDDDPLLGEQWVLPDSDFCMATFVHFTSTFDSIVKASVRNSTELGGDLQFINAVFPVTIYWDMNLLRSDSLPFPIQPIYPYAYFGFDYGNGTYYIVNDSAMSCNFGFPAVLTDTADESYCPCRVKDSLILGDLTGSTLPQSNYFGISLNAWHNCSVGVGETELDGIKIFPNPFTTFINVRNSSAKKLDEYIVYNSIGKQVSIGEIKNSTIDLSLLPIGIYLVNIKDQNKNNVSYKVIKSN